MSNTRNLFIVVFGLGLAASAPAAPLKPHFTVHLITAANGGLKATVENQLTKELTKRSDVDVTQDENADWLIYLNVTPIIDSKGLKGYVVAAIIADQYSANRIRNLSDENFRNPEVAREIRKLTQTQVRLHDHLVQTCAPDGLPAIVGKMVDYFDENFLMPAREDIDNFNLRNWK